MHTIIYIYIYLYIYERERYAGSKVKFEDLENRCAEFIGVIGHWKGHFINLEMSTK
jgi:hypothetical protein